MFQAQISLFIYNNRQYILFQIGGMHLPGIEEIALKLESTKDTIVVDKLP